jgi:hypothetical protein
MSSPTAVYNCKCNISFIKMGFNVNYNKLNTGGNNPQLSNAMRYSEILRNKRSVFNVAPTTQNNLQFT